MVGFQSVRVKGENPRPLMTGFFVVSRMCFLIRGGKRMCVNKTPEWSAAMVRCGLSLSR